MNIELSYTEAIAVKQALDNMIRDSHELLLDTEFEKKYPNCYKSVQDECEKAVAVRDRIQEQLDRL